MKTQLAQLATFAFSAVGALAILVGVIDQPQAMANNSVSPGGLFLNAAAISPAVSPLA